MALIGTNSSTVFGKCESLFVVGDDDALNDEDRVVRISNELGELYELKDDITVSGKARVERMLDELSFLGMQIHNGFTRVSFVRSRTLCRIDFKIKFPCFI